MKLITFQSSTGPEADARPGVLLEDGRGILDVERVLPGTTSVLQIVQGGAAALARLSEHCAAPPADALVALSSTRILAPIPEPRRNIFCVGKNYHEHAKEFHDSGFDASAGTDAIPECPIIFSKSFSTVSGPGDIIPASADGTNSVDYEVELAVVIGEGGRSIKKANTLSHVFGYTIVNDVTSRTLQQQHKQWFLGKNFDGFCPMGPWLVTADEVGDVEALTVTTHVNGELRQRADVRDLIFDIPTLIETLSAVMTLHPGDIIATGTPAGVGIGYSPPKFLTPGDTVKVAISKLGELENPVG
jgi:2-keto-4-pentenoate hydratase/2-oxohepta-3-ene-1,7-dioic acid hydratase in catechol pathway